jgi:hypothetical protein
MKSPSTLVIISVLSIRFQVLTGVRSRYFLRIRTQYSLGLQCIYFGELWLYLHRVSKGGDSIFHRALDNHLSDYTVQ